MLLFKQFEVLCQVVEKVPYCRVYALRECFFLYILIYLVYWILIFTSSNTPNTRTQKMTQKVYLQPRSHLGSDMELYWPLQHICLSIFFMWHSVYLTICLSICMCDSPSICLAVWNIFCPLHPKELLKELVLIGYSRGSCGRIFIFFRK